MPTIKNRRATKSQWTLLNPVLAAGEIGFEIDTNKVKIGNGLSFWEALSYIADGSEIEDLVKTGRLSEEVLNGTYAAIAGTDARKIWSVDPEVAGDSYTPSQRTAYFHALCAAISAAGGSNVLEFPAVEFVIAIENTTPSLSGSTVLFTIPSGTTKRGERMRYDDASAAASTAVLMWQYGEGNAASRDFTVTDAVYSNKAKANGKSLWGGGNRRDMPGAKTDNVTHERCVYDDVTVGVTNARRNPAGSLGDNRDKNWRTINCDFYTSNNRAIELSQINGALNQGCVFNDVESAIHLLLHAENVVSRDNRGTVRTSGFHINAHVHNCEFNGGRFDFTPGVTSGYGAVHFHTEPGLLTYETSALRFSNFYFGKPTTGATQKSLSFMVTEECTAAKWHDVRFTDCVFEGAIAPTPFYTKPGHEAYDFVFTNCDIYGDFTTVSSLVHNVHDWRFVNCRFHSTTPITINAERMFFDGCEFAATPILAVGSIQTEMVNYTAPSLITKTHNSQTVEGRVRSGALINPLSLVGSTVWDADDLTAGPLTAWAPHPGSLETAAFVPVTTAPEVVLNAVGTHKAVRFTSASAHRLLSSDFATTKAQPFTLAYLWKDADTAADQLLISGKTNNQIVTRHLTNGQVAHRATAAGSPIQASTVRAFGAWHCTVVVYNGTTSKAYTDGTGGQSGTLTESEPLAALRIGSTGSGSATGTFNGDWQFLSMIPRALSSTEVAGVLRYLSERAAITLA